MVTLIPVRSSLPPPVETAARPLTPGVDQPSLFGLSLLAAEVPTTLVPTAEDAPDPALQQAARTLVLAVVEVIQGRRNAEQLVRWVTDDRSGSNGFTIRLVEAWTGTPYGPPPEEGCDCRVGAAAGGAAAGGGAVLALGLGLGLAVVLRGRRGAARGGRDRSPARW